MNFQEAVSTIIQVCHAAWQEGFMPGFSGNASIRLDNGQIAVTAAGAPKGRLASYDCILADSSQGQRKPSSETLMHRAIYEALSQCMAILHTHPPYMQALNLALDKGRGIENIRDNFLNLPLFEARVWRQRLFFAGTYPPGSAELANAAANALPKSDCSLPCALWLSAHGLCALAGDLPTALCITEEMEHLAKVQLLAG